VEVFRVMWETDAASVGAERPFRAISGGASLGQLGRTEEAQEILRKMARSEITAQPRFWEITNPYLHDTHLAHLRDGIMRAGLLL
jgi:hypothetical protein